MVSTGKFCYELLCGTSAIFPLPLQCRCQTTPETHLFAWHRNWSSPNKFLGAVNSVWSRSCSFQKKVKSVIALAQAFQVCHFNSQKRISEGDEMVNQIGFFVCFIWGLSLGPCRVTLGLLMPLHSGITFGCTQGTMKDAGG